MAMGDMFDLFIKYRQHVPEELRRFVNRARLFLFDIFPTETKQWKGLESYVTNEHEFHLPFPVTAVEDKVSCVIVWDLNKDAFGIDAPRGFMEMSKVDNYIDERAYTLGESAVAQGFDTPQSEIQRAAETVSKTYQFTFRAGIASTTWNHDICKWQGRGKPSHTMLFSESGEVLDLLNVAPDAYSSLEYDFVRCCITCYEEILELSNPDKFVLQKGPKQTKALSRKKKYLFTNERPTYTVLEPAVVRKVMQLPEPSPKIEGSRVITERRAHYRKAHDRHLKADRHKEKRVIQVKRAYVPALWNGLETSEIGGHVYRVLLDR